MKWCVVMKLLMYRVKGEAFQSFFDENPDSLLRMVQVSTPNTVEPQRGFSILIN